MQLSVYDTAIHSWNMSCFPALKVPLEQDCEPGIDECKDPNANCDPVEQKCKCTPPDLYYNKNGVCGKLYASVLAFGI